MYIDGKTKSQYKKAKLKVKLNTTQPKNALICHADD